MATRNRRRPRPTAPHPNPHPHPTVELADAPVEPVETDVDLERAVLQLSGRQRQAVDLHYFVGLDVATCAQVMGCAEGTVKATLHQARGRLRALLGDDFGGAS